MVLSKAYATSGKVFEQVSMRAAPAMYEQLKRTEPGQIIVVQGQYDHIETLLDTLKVPYDLIQPADIKKQNGGRVMFANCKTYTKGEAREDWVKEFVNGGGRLVTTDWALSLVQHVFPGKLKHTATTGDDVVEIQCSTDIARKLVGLNYSQCHPQWWLEGSSHVYDVTNGVTAIITSEELKEKYGKPYIAAGFAEGKGEVIHFISHLELQRTRLKTKADKGTLEDFLARMKATKTIDMEDASVAELEAAYSTLNTLAHLAVPLPLLNSDMKSVTIATGSSGASVGKSKKLV